MPQIVDLAGREFRQAVVIDVAYGTKSGTAWNCRCLVCNFRFVKNSCHLRSSATAPACPRCLAPLRAAHGTLGGRKGHPCSLCGERGHYATTCARRHEVHHHFPRLERRMNGAQI